MSILSLSCGRRFAAACVAFAALLSPPIQAQPGEPFQAPVTRSALFAPAKDIVAVVGHEHGGLSAKPTESKRWAITGELKGDAGGIHFKPKGGVWNISDHSLFSVALTNEGPGIVWVQCRLDNNGAQDWANSSASQAFILPGERGVVTVGYPRAWEHDDSPEAFEPASSKPNGWRSHWKQFNPKDVKACRLTIRSSDKTIKLTNVRPYLAWPYGKQTNKELIALPHIDRYGQAIPFDWPTKVKSDADLKMQRAQEEKTLASDPSVKAFNQYGGYAAGPQLKATGFFRTQKHDGKWWLVDPEGKLYWSHGVCTVGNHAGVPLDKERRKLLAEPTVKGTEEHKVATVKVGKYGWGTDFLQLNSYRKYGEDWENKVRDITHRRLRAWGLNALGAWSDNALQDDRRTPFTEILHIWPGYHAFDHTPEPYDKNFEQSVHDAAAKLAEKRKNDPWMIGVFIDNEIVWHGNLVQRVLTSGPKQPSYQPFVDTLKKKYKTIDALNKAWGTKAESWDKLVPGKGKAWDADRVALFSQYANRYYRICREAVDKHLPNHLYLGSRVHTCPPFVADQIAKHVDVFSVNHYAPLAGTAQLPKGADLPVMVTEFHFGTIGRGVTGMSLSPVHDEKQQTRSYAAFVTAGLLNKHVVGTHWFAYSDHNAVGRPNENYRIGLIDVADTPYAELTVMTRAIGERMYDTRLNHDKPLLKELRQLIESAR